MSCNYLSSLLLVVFFKVFFTDFFFTGEAFFVVFFATTFFFITFGSLFRGKVVVEKITDIESEKPYVIATTAKEEETQINFKFLRKKILEESRPFLLLFGTSWGLTEEIVQNSDFVLRPLCRESDPEYNHLSVRAASGIILDKVLGRN